MNRWVGMGRLTSDPKVTYSNGVNGQMAVASFTLAVDRKGAKDSAQNADFITCKAFGKIAEHMEKFWHKGMKATVSGRIQTGSYTNKDGVKVYTTDVVLDEIEFAESKNANTSNNGFPQINAPVEIEGNAPFNPTSGFSGFPDGIEDLPFPPVSR